MLIENNLHTLETDVDQTLRSRISSIKNIPNLDKATLVLDKKSKSALGTLKEQLRHGPVTLENTLDVSFKELYAHSRCYALMEGMLKLFSKDTDVVANGLVLSVDKMPIHWLVKLEFEGNTYFSDAYGIFDSLDDILLRYGIQSDVIEDSFDPDDLDDQWQEAFTGLIGELHDDCAEQLEALSGNTDMDLSEVIDHCDFLFLRDAMMSVDFCLNKELGMSAGM